MEVPQYPRILAHIMWRDCSFKWVIVMVCYGSYFEPKHVPSQHQLSCNSWDTDSHVLYGLCNLIFFKISKVFYYTRGKSYLRCVCEEWCRLTRYEYLRHISDIIIYFFYQSQKLKSLRRRFYQIRMDLFRKKLLISILHTWAGRKIMEFYRKICSNQEFFNLDSESLLQHEEAVYHSKSLFMNTTSIRWMYLESWICIGYNTFWILRISGCQCQ